MIYTHVAALILGAAIAATGAWQVQGWRLGGQIDSLKVAHATELAQAKEAALATERTNAANYQKALNEARTRQAALQRDVASARAESDGLREQAADAARRIATAAPSAVAEYASAAGELLADCSRAHQELAAAADGHAADVRTFTAAWPVSPSRPAAGKPNGSAEPESKP